MPQLKDSSNKDKTLPISILIVGIALLFVVPYLGYFFGGFFLSSIIGRLIGRLIGIILIITAIVLFRKKPDTKTYKYKSPNEAMKIQYIFYSVGVIFIFAAVWYFAREFIDELPDPIKLMILIAAVVITFIIAEFLRGGDK